MRFARRQWPACRRARRPDRFAHRRPRVTATIRSCRLRSWPASRPGQSQGGTTHVPEDGANLMTNAITMVHREVPGLDLESRARLVVGLNQSLATLSDLAAAYKQAHWNVVGIDFSQLHALFDQFADQTGDYVDVVA